MAHKEVDYVLGKNTTKYNNSYDPDVLVQIPRSENREKYGMKDNLVPFVGYDVWHAWEVSFLTDNGFPVTGVLKLIIPFYSPFIVESKSLKLYLFSFSMEKLGDTVREATIEFKNRVKKDLEEVLQVNLDLDRDILFFEEDKQEQTQDYMVASTIPKLVNCLPNLSLIDYFKYTEDPLILNEGQCTEVTFQSSLLRSRCRVSGQPDFATIHFHFLARDKKIDLKSLAQYIVSFRDEHHFHEEIIECMYKRIWDKFEPRELAIAAWYTRRGGIDICPIRAKRIDDLSNLDITKCLLSPRIDYKALRS